MIQFSVCCLTAVRSKESSLVWESCCREVVLGHPGSSSWGWQRQSLGLAHTQSSCPGVAAGSMQSLQQGGSRWQPGELHHPPHNCRCARTGLLLLPPSAPQQYQVWFFSVELHLHQQIQKWMWLQTICAPMALWGSGSWPGCSFRVPCHSPVLQFCTGYFNVKHQVIFSLSSHSALLKH